jgi:hypothetical protein
MPITPPQGGAGSIWKASPLDGEHGWLFMMLGYCLNGMKFRMPWSWPYTNPEA